MHILLSCNRCSRRGIMRMFWKIKGRYSFVKDVSFGLAQSREYGEPHFIWERIVKGHKAKLARENTYPGQQSFIFFPIQMGKWRSRLMSYFKPMCLTHRRCLVYICGVNECIKIFLYGELYWRMVVSLPFIQTHAMQYVVAESMELDERF